MKALIALLFALTLSALAGCRSTAGDGQAAEAAALPEIRYFMIADT